MENQENKLIQLTESDIHDIVDGAVQAILVQEGFWSNMWKATKPIRRDVGSAASNMANKAGNSMRQVGQNVANVARKVGQGASNFGNAMKATGQEMRTQYQSGKLNDARDNAIKALQNYLTYAKQVFGVGNNTTQAIQNAINQITMNANAMDNLKNGQMRRQSQTAWNKFKHPSQFQQ